jgi:hypothetical protein
MFHSVKQSVAGMYTSKEKHATLYTLIFLLKKNINILPPS